MAGRLASRPTGHKGFGYDPLFVADGQTMTNGELEAAAKDSISHRGPRCPRYRSCAHLRAAPAGRTGGRLSEDLP